MKWQDFIFTIGSISFAVALVPMLVGKSKPPLTTSVLTGFWLTLFGGTYLTLGLIFSAVTTWVTAAEWLAVAVQTLRSPSA